MESLLLPTPHLSDSGGPEPFFECRSSLLWWCLQGCLSVLGICRQSTHRRLLARKTLRLSKWAEMSYTIRPSVWSGLFFSLISYISWLLIHSDRGKKKILWATSYAWNVCDFYMIVYNRWLILKYVLLILSLISLTISFSNLLYGKIRN